MDVNFKKSYKFAFKSSLYISLFTAIVLFSFNYYFHAINDWFIAIFIFCTFIFSFFVIQIRVERFIYKRVKKIYDDVSLLENTSFRSQPITTDMATLTKEVKKFARDKQIEIETLKHR